MYVHACIYVAPQISLQLINIISCTCSWIEYFGGVYLQVGVLHWFAALWQIAPEDMWGYVTNGGTEANLQGLFMAREKLQNGEILHCLFEMGSLVRVTIFIVQVLYWPWSYTNKV